MSTRLTWSRTGLVLKCETAKRPLPRTVWAFALPPFAPINTTQPGIVLSLITDDASGVTTGVRVVQAETLPDGYDFALLWTTGNSDAWVSIPLGKVRAIDTTIPVDLASTLYRVKLTRTYAGVTEEYVETSIGTPEETLPPDITGLVWRYRDGQAQISWDAVSDPRPVEIEVRMGDTYTAAKIVARVPKTTTSIETIGSGIYWVATRWRGLYSATPASITIAAASVVANVVAEWDEKATGWLGTRSPSVAIDDSGNLYLISLTLCDDIGGLCDDIPGPCDCAGGVASEGYYEEPAIHNVDLGVSQLPKVYSSWEMSGTIFTGLMVDDVVGLVDDLTMMLDQDFTGIVDAEVQLAIAGNDGVFGPWQKLIPSQYPGRKFKRRIKLATSDPSVSPVISGLVNTVDMLDRWEKFLNIACGTGGVSRSFAVPFLAQPVPAYAILNAQAGDTWVWDSLTLTGWSGHVVNGGSNVARTIHALFQGY